MANISNEIDGMIYFAQRLQEAIFNYTIDIYKAPLLNTNQLAQEYLSVCESIEDETLNKAHLEEIQKEFLYSLDHDVVLKKFWGEDNITQIKNKINTQTQSDIQKTMHYLVSFFGGGTYYNWCISYLKEVVLLPKEKKKIEKGIRCWVPELYAFGYSDKYIYRVLKRCIFEQKQKSLKNFDEFLSVFDLTLHRYKVYFAVKKEILALKSLLQINSKISFDDDGNFHKLKHDSKYVVISIDDVVDIDEFNAVESAKVSIDFYIMMYMALDNKKRIELYKTAMAIEGDNTSFISTQKPLYSIEKYDLTQAVEIVKERIFSLISPTVSKDTLLVLTKIFEKHNYAISDINLDNGFLNFWSIFEIFSSNISEGGKISKIRNSVLVIISNNYYKRIFTDLFKNLKTVLSKDDYLYFTSKVTNTDNDAIKFAQIVLLEQYSEERQKLNSALIKNPKLRSRIYLLNDLGSNVKRMYSTLNKYKDRVSWHIARMYRCRNLIIHSGETDSFINPLTGHIHSYVDILIEEAITCLGYRTHLNNIDDVILYNQLKEEKLLKILNKDVKIDEDSIFYLFDEEKKYNGN